jgi:hypothetical protein
LSRRFQIAIILGPVSTARALHRLLGTDGAAGESRKAEWVADIYARHLSAPLRSLLRDGVVEAIHRFKPRREDSLLLIRLLSLASEIQLLESSNQATQDRLWAIAMSWAQEDRRVDAAHVVGLLAAEGKKRPEPTWTTAFGRLGIESAAACAYGVYRYGKSAAALEWVRVQVYGEPALTTVVALLPTFAAEDRNGLVEYIESLDDAIFLGRMLESIQQVDVPIPVPSTESFLAQVAAIPLGVTENVVGFMEEVALGFRDQSPDVLVEEAFLSAMDAIDSLSHNLVIAPILALGTRD